MPDDMDTDDDVECSTCGDTGTIWVAIDGEVTCPDCGYDEPNK